MATDYWLNKLIFDLQGPDGKDQWSNHREETIDKYPVSAEIRQALIDDNYAYLYPLTNPYLMRFFLLISGNDDQKSIEILSAIEVNEETAHG
ncbi:MAG: hypothetical protein CMM52_05890 [Rhodospirillaceae bacterium]|nr:hypothetical protein [Rhodospirillaceae bacterium]|tara:strand:+ start:21218 stop:21493 length:276 start_codon:yes stop_codon:yes gene_type:complete